MNRLHKSYGRLLAETFTISRYKTILFAGLISVSTMQALPINEEQARSNVAAFIRGRHCLHTRLKGTDIKTQMMEVAYRGSMTVSGMPSYYVFNHSGIDGGFVIASGDDCMPAVLGYSEQGHFDPKNMPCNLRWWLGEYERVMASCICKGVMIQESPSKSSFSVEPLLTCKWNQDDPYNRLCPKDMNGVNCPTGCGPTALSQVMYYHKWPKQGTGSFSYKCGVLGGAVQQTLSADFGNTYYDWGSMRDVEIPATATDATPTLMYHAGVAMEVEYNTGGSGIIYKKEAYALKNFFGYYAEHLESSDVSNEAFRQLLEEELRNSRPVYFAGGNHAFVLDGYKEGYYHFNWGWGGNYDGYFLITDMKPGGLDFSTNHRIAYKIQPYTGEENASVVVDKAGMLRSAVGETGYHILKSLKVSGPLNGTDFLTLREMAGRDIDNNVTDGRLEELDLSDATVVDGGDCYFRIEDETYYKTQNGTKADILPDQAFMSCSNLKKIKLPKSIKIIGRYSFVFCNSLTDLTFGGKEEEIDFSAFNYCCFEKIVVPDHVQSLGHYAFCNMASLKTIVLGSGIKSMGALVFQEDNNIEKIESHIAQPFAIRDDVFSEICYQNATLYVPVGTSGRYKQLAGWKKFHNIVEIGHCATPTIIASGNKLRFECETPDAEFTSYLTTCTEHTGSEMVLDNKDVTYTLTVYATAIGYEKSAPATMTFTISKSDVNFDGSVNIADIATIINEMAAKGKK